MNAKSISETIFLTKKIQVEVDQIIFIEGDVNYAKIFFCNGTYKMVAATLKKLESVLNEYEFIRIHKKYLLNTIYLKHSQVNESFVLLPNNKKIKVSRRKQYLVYQN